MNNGHDSQLRLKPLQQKQHDELSAKISKLDDLNRDDLDYISKTEIDIALLLNSSRKETTDSQLDSFYENILKTEKEISNRNTQKEKLNEQLANLTSDIKHTSEMPSSNHQPKI